MSNEVFQRSEENKLLPSDVDKFPWVFVCSNTNCHWRTAHRSEQTALAMMMKHHTESCPLTGNTHRGERFYDLMSIIEALWKELDDSMAVLMAGKPDAGTHAYEEYLVTKGQAQGLAIAIYSMSRPHFEDVKAVAKWAGKRYKMNKKEIEREPTPGCDGYNPMPLSTREVNKLNKAASTAKLPARKVDGTKLEIIKNGLKANLPIHSLAKLVKLTEEQVLSIKEDQERSHS